VLAKVRLCRETAGQKELARRRSFEEIVAIVERLKGETWLDFRDRYGDWGRDVVLWAGRKYGGMTLKELGAAAGGMDYVAVAAAVRRIAERSRSKAQLRAVLKHVTRKCIM
jgi:chromosomal replication initiation ATPase DnaA